MSSRNKHKGRLAPFVPILKDTIKTEAWRALSHGARSLYVALKGRYNTKLQNAVYVSTRAAEKELGRASTHRNVMRWFRELKHYGFIVMVSPAHHGVNGHGKAPHFRLTEEWFLGKKPTRDFLSWDGTLFTEKRKRTAPLFTAKNRTRGDHGVTTLVHTGSPLVPKIGSQVVKICAGWPLHRRTPPRVRHVLPPIRRELHANYEPLALTSRQPLDNSIVYGDHVNEQMHVAGLRHLINA